jgi:hypothetical protein
MLVAAVSNVPAPGYPWQYASVFSLAASQGSDPLEFHSNPAPPVEFGARGIGLEVPLLGGSTVVRPAVASPRPTSPAWSRASSAPTRPDALRGQDQQRHRLSHSGGGTSPVRVRAGSAHMNSR